LNTVATAKLRAYEKAEDDPARLEERLRGLRDIE
jgi:hypothetical protein